MNPSEADFAVGGIVNTFWTTWPETFWNYDAVGLDQGRMRWQGDKQVGCCRIQNQKPQKPLQYAFAKEPSKRIK